jgi:hypothetical protein
MTDSKDFAPTRAVRALNQLGTDERILARHRKFSGCAEGLAFFMQIGGVLWVLAGLGGMMFADKWDIEHVAHVMLVGIAFMLFCAAVLPLVRSLGERYAPLSESALCQDALRLVREYDVAAQIRDAAVASGRQLYKPDYWMMRAASDVVKTGREERKQREMCAALHGLVDVPARAR